MKTVQTDFEVWYGFLSVHTSLNFCGRKTVEKVEITIGLPDEKTIAIKFSETEAFTGIEVRKTPSFEEVLKKHYKQVD